MATRCVATRCVASDVWLSQARTMESKRALFESRFNATKARMQQLQETKVADSESGAAAVAERLAAMRRAHEEKVERQRQQSEERLNQVTRVGCPDCRESGLRAGEREKSRRRGATRCCIGVLTWL